MQNKINETYLIIGTNLGNKKENLQIAINLIEKQIGKVVNFSSIYETEPWGIEAQPSFYNQVSKVQTNLTVRDLLNTILNIEKEMGRIRKEKYGARIIDIDILFFNNEIYELKDLTVPHPRIAERNFVLAPMLEVAENYLHPKLGKKISELWNTSQDKLKVKKIKLT